MNKRLKAELICELDDAIDRWMTGNLNWYASASDNGIPYTIDYEEFMSYCDNFSLKEVVEGAGGSYAAAKEFVDLYENDI